MFPEMFGHENTLFGPKGKAHKVFEGAKGSFAESRGQTPGSLASGSRRREPWRLALESEKDSFLSGETDFAEATGPNTGDPSIWPWARCQGLWRLVLESEWDSCLSGKTDFEEAFAPSFDPRAQHINRGAGLAPMRQIGRAHV